MMDCTFYTALYISSVPIGSIITSIIIKKVATRNKDIKAITDLARRLYRLHELGNIKKKERGWFPEAGIIFHINYKQERYYLSSIKLPNGNVIDDHKILTRVQPVVLELEGLKNRHLSYIQRGCLAAEDTMKKNVKKPLPPTGIYKGY